MHSGQFTCSTVRKSTPSSAPHVDTPQPLTTYLRCRTTGGCSASSIPGPLTGAPAHRGSRVRPPRIRGSRTCHRSCRWPGRPHTATPCSRRTSDTPWTRSSPWASAGSPAARHTPDPGHTPGRSLVIAVRVEHGLAGLADRATQASFAARADPVIGQAHWSSPAGVTSGELTSAGNIVSAAAWTAAWIPGEIRALTTIINPTSPRDVTDHIPS